MASNSFTIMPRILSHLGDELIRNEIIALTELVKNSYDAGANNCTVKFYFNEDDSTDYKPTKIVIFDDGDGMSKEEIQNYWLTVGTDHKKKDLLDFITPKRMPLGEKGIGRFGVHKLGRMITVKTKKAGLKPLRFKIDWNKLNKAQSFDDFGVNIVSKNVEFPRENGLTYVIKDIKGTWSSSKLRKIYRALTALNTEFRKNDCKLIHNPRVSRLTNFMKHRGSDDEFRVKIKAIGNNSVFKKLKTFKEIKESALYECDMLISGDQIIDFQYNFHPRGDIKDKFDPRSIDLKGLSEAEKLLQRKFKKGKKYMKTANTF